MDWTGMVAPSGDRTTLSTDSIVVPCIQVFTFFPVLLSIGTDRRRCPPTRRTVCLTR